MPRDAHTSRFSDPTDLAGRVLSFMAEDGERLGEFLAATGLTVGSLRSAAAHPGFPRGVLAYLMADERLLVAFASSTDQEPESLARMLHAIIESP